MGISFDSTRQTSIDEMAMRAATDDFFPGQKTDWRSLIGGKVALGLRMVSADCFKSKAASTPLALPGDPSR